jgi:hypothetical protein
VGEDDDRGVGETELEVAIALAQLACAPESAGVQRLHIEHLGEVVEVGELGVDPESGEDQVVGFCGREGRDDELAVPALEQLDGRAVLGVAGVDGGVERAGVDD